METTKVGNNLRCFVDFCQIGSEPGLPRCTENVPRIPKPAHEAPARRGSRLSRRARLGAGSLLRRNRSGHQTTACLRDRSLNGTHQAL